MTDYATAANTLGVPEAILRRSVEARAKADGVGADELLAAWAGGEAMPAAAPSAPATSAPPETAPGVPAEPAPVAAPAAPVAAPAEAPTPPRPTGPVAPPVLVGVHQRTNGVLAGSSAILFFSILLAFVVPSLPQPATGVRSSNLAYSRGALEGQEIYLEQGCGSCHTQLIRAVVADAKLGPVTLSDSNQVFGYRRVGPDLSAIGGRTEDSAALANLLRGAGTHPAVTGLSDESLASLLTYLRESA